MTTLPKIPLDGDRLPPKRAVLPSIVLLAALSAVAALLLPPIWSDAAPPVREPPAPEPVLTQANAAELCIGLAEDPTEYVGDAVLRRRWDLRRQSCNMAFAAHPEDLQLKVQVARNMPHEQQADALRLLREAAAQGSAEANYEIYEHHKSWDRGDLDKVPLVMRAEAAAALFKAAELGHPFATQMLVRRLEDGDIVKRDPVAARYWAERAVANPAKGIPKANLLVTLGRLLAASGKPEERARGLEILERVAKADVFGAKRELATAIRNEDPVRARQLLEDARRADPGGAIAPLAQMLIAGEGGPADPKRAVSLLKDVSDSWMAKGMLGQLTLEGKWVPRNVQDAVRLIDLSSGYDYDARIQVLQLLAANPAIRVEYPNHLLYDAAEAAELDEPGAMQALIALKLSANTQFHDRAGACKLIQIAISRGDQTLAQRLADCRAG
jgi:TPR repeat protein